MGYTMDEVVDDVSEGALKEEGPWLSESTAECRGSDSAWASRESRRDLLIKSSSGWRDDLIVSVVVARVGKKGGC